MNSTNVNILFFLSFEPGVAKSVPKQFDSVIYFYVAELIVFCKKIRQGLPPCKSYPMEYLRDNLTTILQSNRKDLYNECLKIVDSYGIGKELRKAVKKRLLHIKVAVFIVSVSKAPLKWIKYIK